MAKGALQGIIKINSWLTLKQRNYSELFRLTWPSVGLHEEGPVVEYLTM